MAFTLVVKGSNEPDSLDLLKSLMKSLAKDYKVTINHNEQIVKNDDTSTLCYSQVICEFVRDN